jgi:hypothetical protein
MTGATSNKAIIQKVSLRAVLTLTVLRTAYPTVYFVWITNIKLNKRCIS